MAIFNPDVAAGKDGVPDWTKITKPVSNYGVDKSSGIALATLGQGLEGAAGLAETTVKDIINKDVRNTVEPIRADYTSDLLKAKAVLQGVDNRTGNVGGSPRDAYASASDADLMEGVGPNGTVQPAPAAVEAGLRRIDRIQNMLVTGGGKIAGDDTYYDMRLKDAVTDLRSKYPGFVDYIDTRVAAITGMNPANELVKDLTRQLTQLQTNKKTEYDKWLDVSRKAMGDGLRDARRMDDFLTRNGEAGLSAYKDWYYEENRKRAIIEEQNRVRSSSKAGREEIAATRGADLTNEASAIISTKMNTMVTIAGVGDKKPLMDFIVDAKNNPNKYSAEQLQQMATAVLAEQAQTEAEFDVKAGERKQDDQGRYYSYNSDVGTTEVQNIKKNVISQQYTAIANALTNHDAGLAFSYANRIKRQLDDTKSKIYAGPAGETIKLLETLNGAMGPNWNSVVNQQLIKYGQDNQLNQLFENTMIKAKTGTPKPDGKPLTYNDMAGKSLDLEQSGQINKRMRARYMESGLNTMIEDITSPDAPIQARLNALKFFFSPEGQGVLRHFNNDYTDPQGNFYPGKQTIWNKFTSSAVVSEVKKLSDLDPNVGKMYKDYIEREAGAQLYLQNFKNLNGYLGPDVYVKYNDGESKHAPTIMLMSSKTKMPLQMKDLGHTSVSDNYYRNMQSSINRVNDALSGMDRVYKGLGVGDASDQLLTFLLSQSDADLNSGKWEGISKDIVEAVAASRGKGKLKDVMEKGVK